MKGHLYFIGIVGHAMRGLALATRDAGYAVTGLDPGAEDGPATNWLADHQLKWTREFKSADLDTVTEVIVTGAFATPEFPPIIEAHRRHIPVKSSAQLFGELTTGEQVISVTGTHGKTTTTSLITWILETAGRHPDYLIGIRPYNFDSSVRLNRSSVAVVEGDEYRASPLETKSKVQYYHPDTLILTAVEHDHPDMYPDLAAVERRFRQVIAALPADGQLVVCAESNVALQLAAHAPAPVTSYGLDSGDYTARNLAFLPGGIEFDVVHDAKVLGRLAVSVYGRHNVLNALAATVASMQHGVDFNTIVTAGASFKGAYRRFNIVAKQDDAVTVVDDYAHHPTEVATNIEAAKLHFPGRRVIVVFRPHTYSRTQALLAQYQAAFTGADHVYVTGIEGAREAGQAATVSGQDITEALPMAADYIPDRTDLVRRLRQDVQAGDVVLCFTVSGYEGLAGELALVLNPA